eukprot:GEMP01032136.1.p1 GENE.GEMP01032136.1~~GEMP01032136.1.p1  ORF type:complete len:497 (+),score=94.26 GEMP01032136.1:249-1739(+)
MQGPILRCQAISVAPMPDARHTNFLPAASLFSANISQGQHLKCNKALSEGDKAASRLRACLQAKAVENNYSLFALQGRAEGQTAVQQQGSLTRPAAFTPIFADVPRLPARELVIANAPRRLGEHLAYPKTPNFAAQESEGPLTRPLGVHLAYPNTPNRFAQHLAYPQTPNPAAQEQQGPLTRTVGIHLEFPNALNSAVQQHASINAPNPPAEQQEEEEQPPQPYCALNGSNSPIRQQEQEEEPLDRPTISLAPRDIFSKVTSQNSLQEVHREPYPAKQGSPVKSPAAQVPATSPANGTHAVVHDSGSASSGSAALTGVLPKRKFSPHAQELPLDEAKVLWRSTNAEFASHYEHLERELADLKEAVAHKLPNAVKAITYASEQCSAELESAMKVATKLNNWFEANQGRMKSKLNESQVKLPKYMVTSLFKCVSHMEPITQQLAIIKEIDNCVNKKDVPWSRSYPFQLQPLPIVVDMPPPEEDDDDIRQAHPSTMIFR